MNSNKFKKVELKYVNLISVLIILLFVPKILLSQIQINCIERKIDSLMIDFNSSEKPGAAVMVIKNGKIAFQKGYGLADLKKRLKIDKNTNFRLASISKQFTAMCIMILKERGKLKYDDTLKDIFPDFPEYGRKITIRNLLQHTSGLIDYEDMIPDTQTIQVHDKDVLKMMKSVDSTYFIPGSKYKYSNSGYALLAMIVEKVSGKRYADFLRENIFKPLQMKNSLAYEKGISEIPNRAYGYVKTENEFKERDQSSTSAVLGDGGIYTSLSDYKKWDKALYSNKLINKKTLEEAFTQGILTNGDKINYGFGWMISFAGKVKIIEHGGSTCGFTNHVIRIPEQKLTVLILTNRFGVKKIDEYCRGIINIFANNIFDINNK